MNWFSFASFIDFAALCYRFVNCKSLLCKLVVHQEASVQVRLNTKLANYGSYLPQLFALWFDFTVDSTSPALLHPASTTSMLLSTQRAQELETINKALRAELLQQYQQQQHLRDTLVELSQRLLEAELQRDLLMSAEQGASSTPSSKEVDASSESRSDVPTVSIVEQQCRRIHDLERKVRVLLNLLPTFSYFLPCA